MPEMLLKLSEFKGFFFFVDGKDVTGRRTLSLLLSLAAFAGVAQPAAHADVPAPPLVQFTDVPAGHYASAAIRTAAIDTYWMRDYGSSAFHPDQYESRRLFASALVRAFARTDKANPALILSDVPATDWAAGGINVAVSKGWLFAPKGVFDPNAPVTKTQMDIALIKAIGLDEAARALSAIHTDNGYRFKVPYAFGNLILAAELRFHYNQSSEAREMLPTSPVRRADVAYAMAAAARVTNGWERWSAQRYAGISLPAMTAERARAVEFAFAYAGWPYIYAGEWASKTGAGYCCGAQPQGGFDCSGFVWWVLHAKSASYPVSRSYNGWNFSDRSSAYMGRNAPRKLFSTQLSPMDIVLFDSDGSKGDWRTIDHAGLALGNGWMIHSSGGRGGVSISFIGDGFWRDHLYWGRRIIPGPDPVPPPPPPPPPSPTPTPVPTPTDSPVPTDSPSPLPSPST